MPRRNPTESAGADLSPEAAELEARALAAVAELAGNQDSDEDSEPDPKRPAYLEDILAGDADEDEADDDGEDQADEDDDEEDEAHALQGRLHRPSVERVRERLDEGRQGRSRDRFDREERRPPREKDPIEEGMAFARALRGQELQRRSERQNRNHRARDKQGRVRDGVRQGPKRPIRALSVRSFELPDPTVLTDSKGNRMHLKGKVVRWVREVDHMNRPVQARVQEFRAYGYEIVMDPHTSEPIRSHLGVAMAGPPEGYAARVLRNMPEGALSRDDLMEASYRAVDDLNRAADGEVCRIVESRQHGRRRREEVDRELSRRLATDDDEDGD